MQRGHRYLALWAVCVFSATCHGGSSSTTPSTKIALSGVVRDSATSAAIGGARVEITAGTNAGQTTTADTAGHYVLSNLAPGSMTLRASAASYVPQTASVSPTADLVTDFKLPFGAFSATAVVQDVLSGATIGGAIAVGADLGSFTSDASGALSIVAATSSAAPRSIDVTSPNTVTRTSTIRVPGSPVVLDLIPKTFDLTGFDQMFRTNGTAPLDRWTTAPGLIVIARTLQYVDSNSLVDAVALTEAMSDADVTSLVTDMAFALPLLTGGTFPAFSSVVVQTPDAGQSVHLRTTGFVTVSRQQGLTNGSGLDAVGFGTWQQLGSTVIGGTIALDRTNDTGGIQKPVRYHELGHALGYNHVISRLSVMNPLCCSTLEPNLADQQAAIVAFRRQPGSLTPDQDPGMSLNAQAPTAVWMPPIK